MPRVAEGSSFGGDHRRAGRRCGWSSRRTDGRRARRHLGRRGTSRSSASLRLRPSLRRPFLSGPLRVGGQVKAPHAVFAPQPEYPPLAKQARVQGVVQIEAIIDERGNVVQMKAVSGSGLLIPAAMRAVAQWRYEPTYLNGAPYAVTLTVEVTFHM